MSCQVREEFFKKSCLIWLFIIALLGLILVLYVSKAFALKVEGDKVILSKEELIELSKEIQELEAKLEKAQRELVVYQTMLELEKQLNQAEVSKLEGIVRLKEEQIKVYKEMLELYKTRQRELEARINDLRRDKLLQSILFILVGIGLGKVF